MKKNFPKKIFKNENFYTLNEKDLVDTSMQLAPCTLGYDIGLLTDAGCPNVADPGSKLILLAHQNKISIVPLIGPSSILISIMSSGLNGNKFAFNGYLPHDKKLLKKEIIKYENYSKKFNQSQIFIETPYRCQNLYEEFVQILNKDTFLGISAKLFTDDQLIKTLQVKEWKKIKLNLKKSPTVFIIDSNKIIF